MILRPNNSVFAKVLLAFVSAVWMLPLAAILLGAVTQKTADGRVFQITELKNVLLLSDTFWRAFGNSLIQTICISLGQIALGVLTAYAFSLFQFRGRDFLFYLCLLVILLPFQITMVAQYRQLVAMGGLNALWGLVLPLCFLPTGLLVLRQFLLRVPHGILEAARLDGAGPWTILMKIVLPMNRSGVRLFAFLTIAENWSLFEQPLMVFREARQQPVTVAVRNVVENAPESAYVPCLIYLIPLALLFLIWRHDIVKGMAILWKDEP